MTIFKKNYLLGLIAILSLSFLLMACGQQQEEGGDAGTTEEGTSEEGGTSEGDVVDVEAQEWRFITEETEQQIQYLYAEEFAKRISEKTDGQITVTPYAYGGLGSETDQVTMLQQGGVELAIISPGFVGTTVAEAQLFSLHFLFPDSVEATQEILDNSAALNEDLVAKFEENGIDVLKFWTEGATQWTSNDVPLQTPEDFDGFKMRTQTSPLMIESYEAYGAEATPMSWSELYTALDRGTVQGQENPIFFIGDAKLHEVQEYLTLSNHNNYVAMTTANSEWFDSLGETEQQLITETIDEMRDWAFDLQAQQNEEWLTTIQEDESTPTEVVELTEEQRAAFEEQAQSVYDYYREEVSTVDGEILDKLIEDIQAAEGE